jgi:hypothetical protein
MFSTQGNTQVYSPFGSFVVEQHQTVCLTRHVEDLPRPDLKLGKEHPLSPNYGDERRAA